MQAARVLGSGAALLVVLGTIGLAQDRGPPGKGEPPWTRNRREAQDRAGGLPERVLARQSLEAAEMPPLTDALRSALTAARKAAGPHLDPLFHADGRRIVVPRDHTTIQGAIDAAKSRDVVVVLPGTYHELIRMKDGVKLTSDTGGDGDELVPVEGAHLRLPRRALRTVIDGSKAEASHHGLIDFDPGLGRHTVVDGFTLQNLPRQDHHEPGHAHALNVRGASPVITNCLIQDNGSTGIGNHVVYRDQDDAMKGRDFRHANVAHEAEAVIFHNVLRRNLGLGIGCNHLSAPFILGNEVLANDDSALGDEPSPGIGGKHGARPTLVGNHVHDNPGGGMLFREGDPQGKHPIDVATRPTIGGNVLQKNGDARPAISCAGTGSKADPAVIAGNIVHGAGAAGIGLQRGAFARVEDNLVSGAAAAGIAIHASTALVLDRNTVHGGADGQPGFTIVEGSDVRQMRGNAATGCDGPRFICRDSEVEGEKSRTPER